MTTPERLERFQNYVAREVPRRLRRADVRLARPVRRSAVGGDPRGHVADIDHAVAAARSALQGEWGR